MMDSYNGYQVHRQYSHQSFVGSTHDWVNSHQQNPPGPPPPQPVEYPTPVRGLRPLPNPQAAGARSLRVVNNPDPELHHLEFESDAGFTRAPKKKKTLERLVKGIRRLPQSVFRYGTGHPKSTSNYTTATEGTSVSATDLTGNTLPGYTSKPTSPLATHVRPAIHQMQQLQNQYHIEDTSKSHLGSSAYPSRSSPLPDVVRLSTTSSMNVNSKRNNPSFRITPPTDKLLQNDNVHASRLNHPDGDAAPLTYGTPAERATMMLYSNSIDNMRSQSFSQHQTWANHPTPHPTPPPAGLSRQMTASPGLSYVSEEEPPPVLIPGRTTSHHDSLHLPPPVEIPHTYPDSMRRMSYTSQGPARRDTPPGVIPGAFPTSELGAPLSTSVQQAQAPRQLQEGVVFPDNTRLAVNEPPPPDHIASTQAPTEVLSPVSIHPEPTNDYRKMTLSSPSPDSHLSLDSGQTNHATSTSGYYDPSFSSQLNMNRFERFIKTLYHMPWVAHARVTADYAPGEGIGRKPAKRIKPMSSWYRALGERGTWADRRASRSTASLDLMSNGTVSPRMSLGAGAALLMSDAVTQNARLTAADPSDGTRRGHGRDYERRSRTHGRRHAATWLDHKSDKTSRSRSDNGRSHTTSHHHTVHRTTENSPSPLIPPVYPFSFPTYTYPGFPTYAMPLTGTEAQLSQQSDTLPGGNSPPTERPRGPRPLEQQHGLMYAVPAHGMYAMNPYQQMVNGSPHAVYYLPSAAVTSPALHQNDSASNPGVPPQPLPVLRHQISSPTLMYMQSVPGGF